LRKFFKYLFFSIWIIAVILLFLLGGYYLWEKNKKNDISFTLNGFNKTISLSDFKGKVVLVYFGFTHCPDICPTSLYLMSNTINKLSNEEQSKVVPIFVSVDPSRDTIKILNEYVKYFSKKLIGLTADKKTIDEVTRKYNAFYSMVPMKNSVLKYTVSHTTRIYIIDKKGKLRFSVDKQEQNIDSMLKKIKKLL
jgi:protein SCO1/2